MPCATNIKRSSRNVSCVDDGGDSGVGVGGDDDGQEEDTSYQG